MGIDVQAMNHLIQVHNQQGAFRNTVTLGRQGVHLRGSLYQPALDLNIPKEDQVYCERTLQHFFGATNVDSIDNNGYENATIIHDMNKPLPQKLAHCYDTVIDVGTLEHVFNIGTALNNSAKLCSIGGRIIHILPANGFCGHGFWQFSPELFYSLYSAENGFANTDVYVANRWHSKGRYAVRKPSNGMRVNLQSNEEVYAMVVTQKTADKEAEWQVQQSDYMTEWQGEVTVREMSIEDYKSRNLYRRLFATAFPKLAKWQMKSLSPHNLNLTYEPIATSLS